jgi:predicted patatin/cPLA2 family phospholipase
MERAGEVFVIRPSEALKIGRMSHDREEIVEAYKLGRRDAKKALGALKLWLGEKSNG